MAVEDCLSEERPITCGVPQGSLCGPVLYLAYASTIEEVVANDIQLHGYADDHAFKKAFKPTPDGQEETATITDFQQLLATVKTWMDENRLKMNDSKTECIIFGSKKTRRKCQTKSIEVNGIRFQSVVRLNTKG